MRYADIKSFWPDPSFFEEIYPNVWLMDDHRWAYYLWERYLQKKVAQSLIHIDQHWDAVNDFLDDSYQERLSRITDLDKIKEMVSENNLVRKDSFIAPAIVRGIINEVHFLCFQENPTKGFHIEFLNKFNTRQFIYKDCHTLLNHASEVFLFDIDLDYFNRSDYYLKSDLWNDVEITEFLEYCSHLIKSSPLITIAMSFGYSGSEEDTKHLINLVVSKIIKIYQQ